MAHPYESRNADLGCRHLCMIQGQPTRKDDEAMARFLSETKFNGHALPKLAMPIDPSQIWKLVK